MFATSVSSGEPPGVCSLRRARISSRCIYPLQPASAPKGSRRLRNSWTSEESRPAPPHRPHQKEGSRPAEEGLLTIGLGDMANGEMFDVLPDFVDRLQLDPSVGDRRPV